MSRRPQHNFEAWQTKKTGNDLLSHTANHAVPSALEGFTSVSGMGNETPPKKKRLTNSAFRFVGVAPKKKKPATTYSPTRKASSTIGAGGLYFCVRNGNRCFSSAIVTGNFEILGEPRPSSPKGKR
jgi:hypothetical protein